ncbi:hypothetical protein chiPu_0005178 [Chiloscyllium punctatum]|uniref:Uncharacterized protein n=1 Tax=Chiloscyllium punctatum TaxID=137246 RepID=A0A401S8M3_CHIPU|nr:hypothetical protein [Chiloscyllium punctatum]
MNGLSGGPAPLIAHWVLAVRQSRNASGTSNSGNGTWLVGVAPAQCTLFRALLPPGGDAKPRIVNVVLELSLLLDEAKKIVQPQPESRNY